MTATSQSVYTVIGELVESGELPEPTGIHPDGTRLYITCHSTADVDAWAAHLNLPPAKVLVGRYATVDWPPPPGWCGYTTIDVSCLEVPF